MPLQVIEATDPISSLIQFRTSPVFEMLLSMVTLLKPGRRATWAEAARADLPDDFLAALRDLHGPYFNGWLFFELAVDYDDHQNVPGFFEYVRGLAPADFLFYLVGRIVSREQIAATGLEPEALYRLLESSPYDTHFLVLRSFQENKKSDRSDWDDASKEADCVPDGPLAPLDAILIDVPAFQHRLADVWEWYWTVFFARQVEAFRPRWDAALHDKAVQLAREGGAELYKKTTSHSELMPPLPPDMPYTEIVFIPICTTPSSAYVFYGYGNATVLFDAERTEARVAEIERNKERTLTILKALGDNSRLDILRLIAHYEGEIHGKKIAAKLNLSASAVSRHLNQLKDAGLIVEESQDNRTITYRMQSDAIHTLPDRLVEYLYH